MVDIDPTGFIITLAIGVGVPLLLFSMKGFGKTAEGTLTGTIRLEGLKSNVVEVKDEMSKGFDRIEAILNKRDEEMRKSFNDTNSRIEQLTQKVVVQEYRLKSLERTRINNVGKDRYQPEGENNNDS
jgi:hypothetical protein